MAKNTELQGAGRKLCRDFVRYSKKKQTDEEWEKKEISKKTNLDPPEISEKCPVSFGEGGDGRY